jgi:hypothetical protein
MPISTNPCTFLQLNKQIRTLQLFTTLLLPVHSAGHIAAAPKASSSTNAAAIAGASALTLRPELGRTIDLVCPWLTGVIAVGSTSGVPGVVAEDGTSATGPAGAGI